MVMIRHIISNILNILLSRVRPKPSTCLTLDELLRLESNRDTLEFSGDYIYEDPRGLKIKNSPIDNLDDSS